MTASVVPAERKARIAAGGFDATMARIETNERVLAERWGALEFRLNAIECALERVEKRLWFAVMGFVGAVLAQGAKYLLSI